MERLGLLQEPYAKKIGLNQTFVSRLLRPGEIERLTHDKALILEKQLGQPIPETAAPAARLVHSDPERTVNEEAALMIEFGEAFRDHEYVEAIRLLKIIWKKKQQDPNRWAWIRGNLITFAERVNAEEAHALSGGVTQRGSGKRRRRG